MERFYMFYEHAGSLGVIKLPGTFAPTAISKFFGEVTGTFEELLPSI